MVFCSLFSLVLAFQPRISLGTKNIISEPTGVGNLIHIAFIVSTLKNSIKIAEHSAPFSG